MMCKGKGKGSVCGATVQHWWNVPSYIIVCVWCAHTCVMYDVRIGNGLT